jgi:hypothetical protein
MSLHEPITQRCRSGLLSATKGSFWIAAGLLLWDVGIEGCYTFSMLLCPLWFLMSLVKNVVWRPGWRIAALRVSMPLLTLGIAIGNGNLQWTVSNAHAEKVIKACDDFRVANGRYPNKLEELVPTYLTSVPPAKYCMAGKFSYVSSGDLCMLWWTRYGFYRRIYDFHEKRWFKLD